MRIISIVFIGSLMASPAPSDTAVSGFGARECKFLNAHTRPGNGWSENALTQSVMSWVQGFVSGVNVLKMGGEKKFFDLSAISVDEQWTFIVTYCRRNPTKLISHAADDLIFRRLVEKQISK